MVRHELLFNKLASAANSKINSVRKIPLNKGPEILIAGFDQSNAFLCNGKWLK
jgi:hypothetical protein